MSVAMAPPVEFGETVDKSMDFFKGFSVESLKKGAKRLGLSVEGTKDDIVRRLAQHYHRTTRKLWGAPKGMKKSDAIRAGEFIGVIAFIALISWTSMKMKNNKENKEKGL